MTDTARSWPQVSTQPDLPAIERAVLDRWREHHVFRRSLELRAGGPEWTFYEGPPTANGRPGTHHVEARTFKDVFPRYRTMKGYHVQRKGGWDCHGLPVELEVEKELGLNSKAEIERYGIAAFNARCRESVTRYVDEWGQLTERIGFWVDLDDAYWTMDPAYIDSLWWALHELWERDLIFEDHRVTPYCARCGTGLSDAEVAQGYQTVQDPSVFVRFAVTDGPLAERGVKLVVWTTTPWTLLSNAAVAVGPDIPYQLVRTSTFGVADELLVVAADLREQVLGEDAEVVDELSSADLVGLHYEAPFTLVDVDGDHRYVVEAGYVTATDGSGLVHTAPAFGAEDMETGRRHGLPVINPVDPEGRFTTGPWQGTFVKSADPEIVADLDERGLLLKATTYEHTYPFCWRCKTPLIYYAKPSWYIRTTAQREQLLANNAKIDWHPSHIREGRFGNWLENNVDWALSRDRYWGTPLPFWRCEGCSRVTVASSRAHLSQLAGRDLAELDPHRPAVDEVTVTCPECGGTAQRIPDVADTWFDSGAMPYAQWGYPHRGQQEFDRHFPADFICEAIDQTRGWFYTLLAESTLLFDTTAYQTVLCLGHIVDEDGHKMSKSRGNILDPWELIERHGADALRYLMLAEGNPWVNRRVGHHLLEDIVRRFLLTLWNTHYFFTTYAAIDGFTLDTPGPGVADRPAADRWVLAELADVAGAVDRALEGYDTTTACRRVEGFVDDLSNWYVRRNRRRFWKSAGDDPGDKAAAYHTLHTCLATVAQLLAPLTPFLAERLWQDLVVSQGAADAPDSVHLTDFPQPPEAWRDEDLRAAMRTARRVVELGRQARNESGMKVRQPLRRALVTVPASERDGLRRLLGDVAEELNVHEVELSDGTGELVERQAKPNFRALGPAFQKDAPRVAEAVTALSGDELDRVLAELDQGGATLIVDGRDRELTPGMVDVVETPLTGWQLATEGSTSFALDLTLDDELRAEGAAREIVRALNDQRKALGLALDDRVEISVDVEPHELAGRFDALGLYTTIADEVLATRVQRVRSADAEAVDLGPAGTAWVAVHR